METSGLDPEITICKIAVLPVKLCPPQTLEIALGVPGICKSFTFKTMSILPIPGIPIGKEEVLHVKVKENNK
jgi:hypothetical protein